MIHHIYSNLPGFKDLRLRPGMNILLADKSPGASDLQTRNGAGKTSFVELVHFLLGATADKGSLFKSPGLADFWFGMDFDLSQARTRVERSGREPSKLVVRAGSVDTWPVKPKVDRGTGQLVISNMNWRTVLGELVFGLPPASSGLEAGSSGSKYGPTFRSLFSYFARRQLANAFFTPVKQSGEQNLYDQEVAITYLIGMDWTIPQRWEEVRQKEKSLKELRKAAAGGSLGTLIGTTAELRTKLAVAEERTQRLRGSVERFHVLPEYRELENELTRLNDQLGNLADENTIDRRLALDLQQALQSETDPSVVDLERVYQEVGVALPQVSVRRFHEVRAFHQSIIENRRSYLSGEIEAATQRIAQREIQTARLDSRRAELMGILQSHGALDQYTKLQSELSRREAETERLRQQFQAAQQLEGEMTQVDIERRQLSLRLQQDFREQADTLRQAILAFERTSSSLYENAGSLTVQESANGPVFEVTIPSQKSKGINNMQIFCFDMMLMRLCSQRGMGPGFLIHDSHLFDGVDERQVARALQIGANEAKDIGFQYIVTMNSDVLPASYPGGLDIVDYVLPVRLTDASEEGGLFGRRCNCSGGVAGVGRLGP